MREQPTFKIYIGYGDSRDIVRAFVDGMEDVPNTLCATMGIAIDGYREIRPENINAIDLKDFEYVVCLQNTTIKTINALMRLGLHVYMIMNAKYAVSTNTESGSQDIVFSEKDAMLLKFANDLIVVDKHHKGYDNRLRRAVFLKALELNDQTLTRHHEKEQEHVLVCLSSSPSNATVIRHAAQLSQVFAARFTAVCVSSEDQMDVMLRKNIGIAEEYNAHVVILDGVDVGLQIFEYAKISKATKIVVGRSRGNQSFWFGNSIVDTISKASPDIDIYIIPEEKENSNFVKKLDGLKFVFKLKEFLFTLAAMVTVIGLSVVLDYFGVREVNIIMVHLLGVLFVSIVTSNYLWSTLASIFSVLTFNFFFTVPRFTLNVSEQGYPLTLVMMFVASFTVSTLAHQLMRGDRQSARKTYRTEILLETSLNLQNVSSVDAAIHDIGEQLERLSGKTVLVFKDIENIESFDVFSKEDDDSVIKSYQALNELHIVAWVFANNQKAGHAASRFKDAKYTYYAVRSNNQVCAVFGIEADNTLPTMTKGIIMTIISELGFAIESLQLSKEKYQSDLLAQKERVKSDILRTISHDLRTPLTSIRGNAENLLHHRYEKEVQDQMVKDIHEDALWLSSVVDNLLSMTRLDHGSSVLSTEKYVLQDIVFEAIQRVQQKNADANIEFEEPDMMILSDVNAQLMGQVLVNLIDNAVKFSEPKQRVSIRLKAQDEYAILEVCDTGKGISDSLKKRVFEMFYTTPVPASDSQRGLGLGLYLCKAIVEAHQGYMEVYDNIPQGSVFRVVLKRSFMYEN